MKPFVHINNEYTFNNINALVLLTCWLLAFLGRVAVAPLHWKKTALPVGLHFTSFCWLQDS